MKSKKLGRSELLSWLNKTVESEYLKVEDLSDGVGFCQILEAFFKNISHELNTLKLNSINDIEQKQKNLSTFNIILGKAGCPRQIDPIKMSKGIFSLNLEFLQYLFDFLYKTFGSVTPKKKYNGLKRRLEILKNQGNKNLKNINKLMPQHLITNKLSFQLMNKNFDFVDMLNDNNIENNNDINESKEKENINDNSNKDNLYTDDNDVNENDELDQKLDKYILFFKLLQEDLSKYIKINKEYNNDIKDAEEEKDYYLDKLQTIYDLCKNQESNTKNENLKKICEDIMNIISKKPDDFK
jgi:RP/EB family microtubule-associated protein